MPTTSSIFYLANWIVIVQQDLQYQGSGTAAAIEDTAAYVAGDASGADATTQAERDAWLADHTINVRLTIPLPFARCYLTILGGKERRTPDRRASERRKNPLVTKGNIIFLGVLGLITGLALLTLIQFAARFVLERAGVV